MKRMVLCPLSHKALRSIHWAILIFPIFFCGCFDAQDSRTQPARGKGIATLGRYFSYNQSVPAEAATETASDFRALPFLPQGITISPDLAQDVADLDIAIPGFFGDAGHAKRSIPPTGVVIEKTAANGGRGRLPNSGDLSILNSSFSQLFSSVFNESRYNENAQSAKEDVPNPFTEERLKREASSAKTSAETATTKSDAAAKAESKATENSGEKSTADTATPAPSGAGLRWEKEYLILGDFDGSGRLSARLAQRSGEAAFVADDGERGFNLYANYAALDQRSSFYVDDIDGDGITDMLITSGASLFGVVMLGDGNGGYRIADKFVTGYEPIVPSTGPFRDGKREIVTVNTRTGVLTRFVPADRYRSAQTQVLSLLPDFLLHLFAPDISQDFLMAGQIGGAEQILGWNENGILQPTASSLGADPTSLSSLFGAYSLQIFQVGNYASIVLSSQGKLFNVANLHVTPQTYLVLGDIYRQGLVDVGVGTRSYFTPKR